MPRISRTSSFDVVTEGEPRSSIVDQATDDVLASADVALLASGTVTVQAAISECPMVVVYRLSPLTYRLGRRFVHVNTFAMANLVAGRQVVPELMQDDFTPDAVASHAISLLQDPSRAAAMRAELARGEIAIWACRARAAAPPRPCSRWHGGMTPRRLR